MESTTYFGSLIKVPGLLIAEEMSKAITEWEGDHMDMAHVLQAPTASFNTLSADLYSTVVYSMRQETDALHGPDGFLAKTERGSVVVKNPEAVADKYRKALSAAF